MSRSKRAYELFPIVVVIPAHNEAENLAATIASVRENSVQVDRILVISDNSTDDTVQVAKSLNVEVMETFNNTARKAGALNQALASLEPTGSVLIMDADTQLTSDWIENAIRAMKRRVGGVGAVFEAAEPTSYLELCQRLEWIRYAEETGRTGKTFVLSGTAALIRWTALESVKQMFGRYYDESTITEDSRMSIDLKLAGWVLKSPLKCRTITETMPTWKMLWLQRRRWYLGAIQNVSDVGLNRVTLAYWRQQILLALAVILMGSYITYTSLAVGLYGVAIPTPFWLLISGIFVVERVVTVWDEPLRRKIFAALLIPELVYALVLQSAYLGAVFQKLRGSSGVWAHVDTK